MPFERWLHVLTMRVRALFRGRALDDDLDEELRWHVEHLVDALRGLQSQPRPRFHRCSSR